MKKIYKPIKFQLRLSEKEKAMLDRKAEKAEMSASEYIRHLIRAGK